LRKFAVIRKGFDVRPKAGKGRTGVGARSFAPLAVFAPVAFSLAACAGLPQIGGAPLPPEGTQAQPIYRDLADIPDPPPITPMEANQGTIQALTEDRAKTAQAAEDLRRQPFNQPDSATQPGF
jgi:hypothetical protein